ncbi:hypothetical protein NP233_g5548 [Leucocoprinus birnbaumii]|uniref:Uncharacterized protein n=1 Tax=Leucocoprinus birnbaumii TaxID=56174 RepID=A0AAD5VSM9_9AGAR|nr:hypothetical protein NP233_g5548 [Leucocoprinus birnbaumii]
MVYDALTIRSRLLRQNGYVARPGWINTVGWYSSGKGHYLIETHSSNAGGGTAPTYCTVVANIDADRLYMGPTGNHNPAFQAPFSASKFQMTLKCPENDSILQDDWKTTVQVLRDAQTSIAGTNDHRYFLITEGATTCIRLSAPVFEKIDPGNPVLMWFLGCVDPEAFDISTWPVPADHKSSLDTLASSYTVLPLAAYDVDEKLISLEKVQSTLSGALAEVTFSLRHYAMGNNTTGKFDCFSGRIEQIVVLRPPGPPLPSPYRNFRRGGGPWRLAAGEVPSSPSMLGRSTFTPCTPTTVQSLGAVGSSSPVDLAAIDIARNAAQEAVRSPVASPPSTPQKFGRHPYTNLTPITKMVDSRLVSLRLQEAAAAAVAAASVAGTASPASISSENAIAASVTAPVFNAIAPSAAPVFGTITPGAASVFSTPAPAMLTPSSTGIAAVTASPPSIAASGGALSGEPLAPVAAESSSRALLSHPSIPVVEMSIGVKRSQERADLGQIVVGEVGGLLLEDESRNNIEEVSLKLGSLDDTESPKKKLRSSKGKEKAV